MKKFLALLLVCGFAGTAMAALRGSPYGPHLDQRFSDVEVEVDALQALPSNVAYTSVGISNKRIARVTYNVTAHGTSTTAHGLGVTLPAKSIITDAWFIIDGQFVDAGSGTVALSCEDANNIFTAADVTGHSIGTIVQGRASGAVIGGFISGIAAACEVTATVATAGQTNGILTLFLEYVIQD